MEQKQVNKINGEYICNIDISVDEWKSVLQDTMLMNDNYMYWLIMFYREPGHKSTCKYIGEKYGVSPQVPNGTITNFAKAVQKKLNRFNILGTTGSPTYWIIPMKGKDVQNGLFEWTLRPELVKAIEEMKMDNKPNYWLVGYSFGSTDSQLDNFYKENIWVSHFDIEKDKKQIELVESIKVGDILVLKSTGTKGAAHNKPYLRMRAIGIVEQIIPNKQEKNEYEYTCKVKYIHTEDRDFDGNEFGAFRKTIHKLTNTEILKYVNKIINGDKTMNKLDEYISLLKNNHNLIFTGAPGTGKTFLAKQIACQMRYGNVYENLSAEEKKDYDDLRNFVQFHPSYDYTDFVEGLRPTQDDNGNMGFERCDGVFKDFCKKALDVNYSKVVNNFDESWEKLLDLVKNNLSKNQLTKIGSWDYSLSTKDSLKYNSTNTKSLYSFTITKQNIKDTYQHKQARPSGAFQKDMEDIVKYMKQNTGLKDNQQKFELRGTNDKPFIFIIDEINRGEISKIFGELFFSIDPGYRGEKGKVQTQYQNLVEDGDEFKQGFYVPENVYIIGTMNDIDRSVESMDFAMRRRFAWYEITADESAENMKLPEDAKARMKRLNTAISKIEDLNDSYFIGGAYFRNCTDFDDLWNQKLRLLLKEYLRGNDNDGEKLKVLKAAYDNEKDPSQDDNDDR